MRWISNPRNSPKAKTLAAALADSKLGISPAALPCLPICWSAAESTNRKRLRAFFRRSERSSRPAADERHETALDRLEAALERKEKILIYGDYDVDGTTAIVILKTAIELCGGAADFHVPHRIRRGLRHARRSNRACRRRRGAADH